MERVWGGRELSSRLGRSLPGESPIGESWEIVDRAEAQSAVADGPLRGKTLHELWTMRRAEIFGERHASAGPRFPLLCKLLDARDRLSVQVHPPASVAAGLGGEPKTEMWYFLACDAGSRIYAGLAPGTTRAEFEKKLRAGDVEQCLHILPTREGDSIFIPSGRLHAIGEGNIIVEIQQNSDTTYRVFDWNRAGLDGKPRELHLEESMVSTDFADFAPPLTHAESGTVAECDHFHVAKKILSGPEELRQPGDFSIVTVVGGRAECGGRSFAPGDFFLLPASGAPPVAPAEGRCAVLVTTIP
ncbi:MAG: mannose-6-phosphate isomerase [Chthoniobacterales bacterium]|nr:mannose-6-phosphate isomerase [Chthoniobacterales bacterium]